MDTLILVGMQQGMKDEHDEVTNESDEIRQHGTGSGSDLPSRPVIPNPGP